jgi:long-chain fatty acid transport protein
MNRTAPLGSREPNASADWHNAVAVMVITSSVLSFENRVVGEGFRNPPPGTFDLGRAGGRIAQVDDSSAVQQNPANLVDVPGAELQFTPSVVYISAEFKSPTGQSATTTDPWKLLPNAFASAPLFDGNAAIGLGVTVPFGLSNDWDQNSSAFAQPTGVLRYQTPYSAELQTININPAFSVRIGDFLQVGAGLDVMWSQVTLKQFYPWFIFPGSTGLEPDGHLEAKGDGIGIGGNIGLTVNLTEHQRVAVTYRSPITVNYQGDFTVDNITPVASAIGVTPRSDFSTQVTFPTIVAAGYGIELSDTLRVEADFEWVQFSRFKSLDLSLGNNAVLLPSTSIPQNWKDTFTAGFGGDWRFATNWVLRAGYQFYESPVPDSTFSPTIPDANQNVITVGIGYKYHRHSFEAAYGLDFYADRNITNDQNPAFNGKYQFTVHLLSFAYRYTF